MSGEASGWFKQAIFLFACALIFWGVGGVMVVLLIYYFTGPWGVCASIGAHGGCL